MLGIPSGNRFDFRVDNFGANPSTSIGTSVTPGTSNSEGNWQECISDTLVTEDLWGIYVCVNTGNTSNNDKSHLLDIGYDPAGGTAYAAVIENIVCGLSANGGAGPPRFYFPLRIPAGAAIAARVQGSNATAGTVRVAIRGYGKPSRPDLVRTGAYAFTVGTITNSGGVSYTPGNGADGTPVSLGTTPRDAWWWQLGMQISNGTIGAQSCYTYLSHGDGTNYEEIMKHVMYDPSTVEVLSWECNSLIEGYREVPAGATMYVMGRCSGAPTSGYNAVAIGIGG